MRRVTLIAGPTASGKSSVALALARTTGAHVVNADSMQVYDVLRVLTARPGPEDTAAAPHHLFGHVSPARDYSTGQWARDVTALLDRLGTGTPLVFVGGTGLYFRALTQGLSPMPEIEPSIRAHWRERLRADGAPALHAILTDRDREAAATLEPGDGQRIVRALEVLDASGRSIGWWRAQPASPVLAADALVDAWLLLPDRAALHERIEARFDAMVEAGALDEVRALLAMDLDPDRPAMKAIGVPELAAVLDGSMAPDDAIARAKAATRQYAKRQITWWRHQKHGDWQVVASPEEVGKSAPKTAR